MFCDLNYRQNEGALEGWGRGRPGQIEGANFRKQRKWKLEVGERKCRIRRCGKESLFKP